MARKRKEAVAERRRGRADLEFEAANAEWQTKLAAEQEFLFEALADNRNCDVVGLPHDLPEYTRNILKVAMAADRLGPQLPKRSQIYAKHGV